MPDGSVQSFNLDRMWTGGVMLNDDGAVLSSGVGGIMWNHPQTGRSDWLLHEIDGEAINGVNEMIPDGRGGIFFGTGDLERVVRGEATRPTAIYQLTVDRQLIRRADDIGFSNGIMYDGERARFYCNDTFHCTWVFDVGPDLALANKKLLLKKDDVDGMALDAEGNIWITGCRSNYLTRLRPDGSALSRVTTPAGAITQVRFGGHDMRDMYINSVPADGADGLKDGDLPSAKSSILYRGRSEVPGMQVAAAGFRLA
jgi:sugar lactone lactonase YvrE